MPGVLLQEAAAVRRAEVLPVQHRAGEHSRRRPHVGVDEVVVAPPAHPGVPVADIGRVVQQRLVVGADVQGDGDDAGGVDARGGGVDGQLADRDAGPAAHAPVADAEDLLRVGGHDQVDVVRPQPQGLERPLDAVWVVDGQEHAPGAPVLVAVGADRLGHRGVVHDGQHLAQVIAQQPVVQDLVPVAQGFHEDVLLQVGRLRAVLRVRAAHLLVQGLDDRRQQPLQAQLRPLARREGRALVQQRLAQHREAAQRGDVASVGLLGEHRSRQIRLPLAWRHRNPLPSRRPVQGAAASSARHTHRRLRRLPARCQKYPICRINEIQRRVSFLSAWGRAGGVMMEREGSALRGSGGRA